jgi:hypothetical protein
MKIKITGSSSWQKIIGLRVSAIFTECIAVWLGFKISDSFSGNCGDTHPSIAPAGLVVLAGLFLAFLGTINIYKARRYTVFAISLVLAIICIVIGLYSLLVAAFQLCF